MTLRTAPSMQNTDLNSDFKMGFLTVENFKDTPVTLRLAEQIDALRRELGRHSDQPASWSLGRATTLPGEPIADETDADRVTFEAPLPARTGDTPEAQTFFLELVFQNQW